ncbi:MAG: flagellar brake protein, partial [Pseudomonadota bacterium]|nr:flagellar brake protein [Pseudomonadota bacterium]
MTTDRTEPSPTAPDANSGYDRYMLREPRAIRGQLQRLIDNRCTLTVSSGGAPDTAATALLGLAADHMWIDVPRNPALMQRLLHSERLGFDARLESIEVRFSTGPPVAGTHAGAPALRVPLPER